MKPSQSWSSTRRVVTLFVIAVAGGAVVAGPAFHSEIDNAYAAGIRLLAGVICGAILAPVFVVAAWRKHPVPAAVSVFVPALAAAVLIRLYWSDDYSLTHAGVPLSYVTALVMFFVVSDRVPREGRCSRCGYDIRARPSQRCPECGQMPEEPPSRAIRRRARIVHGIILAAALIGSGALQAFFIHGLLSLG